MTKIQNSNIEKIAYTFIVAGCVIKQRDKFLLVQEKHPRCYGQWNLPAGRVQEGDSIEETAIKEAKEETGFKVHLIRKLAIFHEKTEKPVQHAFEAKIISGKLEIPKDELLDVKWFTLKEIEEMKDKLRGEWVLRSIKLV